MHTSVAHLDEVLPLALRQRAENAVPEAANAAWVDQVVKEVPMLRWGGIEWLLRGRFQLLWNKWNNADEST